MSKEELLKSIYWMWSRGKYQVIMNGDVVFSTENERERDLFMAELRAKILLDDKT